MNALQALQAYLDSGATTWDYDQWPGSVCDEQRENAELALCDLRARLREGGCNLLELQLNPFFITALDDMVTNGMITMTEHFLWADFNITLGGQVTEKSGRSLGFNCNLRCPHLRWEQAENRNYAMYCQLASWFKDNGRVYLDELCVVDQEHLRRQERLAEVHAEADQIGQYWLKIPEEVKQHGN